MIFSMVYYAIFYIVLILLLPYSLYLFWKRRRIAGLIAMGIFLAPIIYVYIHLPEIDCIFEAEDQSLCTKENNYEYR
jgi:uncharacterized MnhB-related membrane protein